MPPKKNIKPQKVALQKPVPKKAIPQDTPFITAFYVEGSQVVIKDFLDTPSDIKLASAFLQNFPDTPIRIDYHNVLDTLEKDFIIPNSVVISYIGDRMNPSFLDNIKADISSRIMCNQISRGILVYKRGKAYNANKFIEPGSKAWVCENIPFSKKAAFFDDSQDHIQSVNYIGIKKHEAILITSSSHLKEELLRRI